ncbi:DUF2004 domain-containing protein [Capnocytophaga gingivalis]|uniref:DUF2004 domain-containing protein n=1 Tax=Capnocytophaga gingivalis TaxID=1017 RepID=A0ABU5Y9A5_9FLAO|nr:DUF2004 domain-containing protein [Capnocytophaga gingivalis]MEB3040517.1 DUF2004 domain-containing protein [Capnocytophaga gingivalis]
MKHLKHAYFGELNTEGLDDYDILWKGNIPYKNGSVRVKFWFCGKDDLSVERLDSFEKFLKGFDAVDEKSRKALKAYLEEEPEYLDFHAEELENIPENVDDFVTEMQIKSIGLWYSIYEGSIGEVIIDYMIRPEETDEILAVKYHLNGEILAIDWES